MVNDNNIVNNNHNTFHSIHKESISKDPFSRSSEYIADSKSIVQVFFNLHIPKEFLDVGVAKACRDKCFLVTIFYELVVFCKFDLDKHNTKKITEISEEDLLKKPGVDVKLGLTFICAYC